MRDGSAEGWVDDEQGETQSGRESRTREWRRGDLWSAHVVVKRDMVGGWRMEGSDSGRKYDSQHSADLQSWGPLVLEDIKADTAELV
jgi:hypothetical protein